MNVILVAVIVIAALGFPAEARDPNPPPKTTDEFSAICWYTMLEELCGLPVTARQRAALKSVTAKVTADSVEGEETTANVMCASYKDDAKGRLDQLCTPILREHFSNALDDLAGREGIAP